MSRGLFLGLVVWNFGEIVYRFILRSRERRKEDSKRGWFHHVKVFECKVYFKARKCFQVLRVYYHSISIPVLGRNR